MSRVHFPVTALGPGRRLGLWFQGCSLGCKGCMSRDTWDPAGGQSVAVADLIGLWRRALAQGATGLTVSGGEPAEQAEALRALLAGVREVNQAQASDASEPPDVLMYTGHDLADLCSLAPGVTELVDAVITGRYDISRPTALIWRGSENQTLHLLSPLGLDRYRTYLDQRPESPQLQVAVDDDDIWFVGLPRRGDLGRLEASLRAAGITSGGASWRP